MRHLRASWAYQPLSQRQDWLLGCGPRQAPPLMQSASAAPTKAATWRIRQPKRAERALSILSSQRYRSIQSPSDGRGASLPLSFKQSCRLCLCTMCTLSPQGYKSKTLHDLVISHAQNSRASRLQEALLRLRETALAAFMRAYPFIHMAQEGLTFSYQLAYLLQSSPYFSPTLHLLGQHAVRTSAQELVSLGLGPEGQECLVLILQA